MVVQGVKAVSSSRNGLASFILQCKRLDLHYCDWAGSSRGMKSFLTSPMLADFTSRFPSTEFRVSPRPNKHPVLKAYYINGREKAVCVRNLEKEQILQKLEFLITNSGKKNELVRGKSVVSTNEGVRGIWSPMHGGIKSI
ncbi:uncharacterized protein PV06_08769 [Exophiala oligosperma]|uniref:Large ribosomal subunit protein mL43 n=2 Tax=Chaetothyriales TaxID=34395 RepID=A0A0D2DTM0_9EURO|nr:uncharacterized protein PV06_08769 [Exophiala oligosperma]KAJ9644941.1 39S ribosomal protein L51, mitochondrial [Knufia peltigerae]KIW38949.1 hypothetical protein PV06_08769 [Exophiala oligosperma]